MSRICVATSKARAYYSIVTRLRKAGLPFVSVVPGADNSECDLVLTTRGEMEAHNSRAFAVEELDESPQIFRGQVLSRLDGGKGAILIGVDPGTRTGMAAYYGDAELGFSTFDSPEELCSTVAAFVKGIPAKRSLVRIGTGSLPLAMKLGAILMGLIPDATIELVDEAGTSSRGAKMKGVQGDQRAAARIALRKGVPFNENPRSRL